MQYKQQKAKEHQSLTVNIKEIEQKIKLRKKEVERLREEVELHSQESKKQA